MIQKCWYFLVWFYIKIVLFFYVKKIRVVGKEHIPKKGAVLFAVNHPNGLIDPLIVTSVTTRTLHFLVRAGAFNSALVKKLLGSLNLMPIYRIRDGVQQLSKNEAIFQQCFSILQKQKALMIFPEGSHNRKRTLRVLSKGFTRIVFGALEKDADLEIQIVPVGLTYQNASYYPAKVALHFGEPILARQFYTPKDMYNATLQLKTTVAKAMQNLTVHIPDNEHYQNTLNSLNAAQVDFTKVTEVHEMIARGKVVQKAKKGNVLMVLKYLIVLNSVVPWLIWKRIQKSIREIEFVDTFRFGVLAVLIPLFYGVQTLLVSYFINSSVALYYIGFSLLALLLYTKCSPTPTEELLE